MPQKTGEKSSENKIFAKGNNSSKRRSKETKVELDLYYVKTNPYTKFQVNISKDDGEKFGKPSGRTPSGLTDGQTDRQTDRQTEGRTDRVTDGEETYSPPGFTGRGLIIKQCKDKCEMPYFKYLGTKYIYMHVTTITIP